MSTNLDVICFAARVRFWNEERGSGLAVADIPAEHVPGLGGLKQQRVQGTFDGHGFTSNVMPAGGGRLALSVSRAMMKSAGVGVGDSVVIELSAVGRD